MTFVGMYCRTIALEVAAEGHWTRLFALLYIPFFLILSGFFAVVVAECVFQILGPSSQLKKNSTTYSVVPPKRISNKSALPHVTIQIPVHKENFETVIAPTLFSLLRAIRTYELQGGTASIFVNDDGLQLISARDSHQRVSFYRDHQIGYVARPPESNLFKRAGRFKKASNMNYCMDISRQVEYQFNKIQKQKTHPEILLSPSFFGKSQSASYEAALNQVLSENEGAIGGGDILIGDVILLVDSDTRIPEDCLIDGASELAQYPEVAILQNASDVMMVVNDYWEHLISWFTRLIYFSISCATACGDTASFVGHNAYLRWSAIQEVAYWQEGKIKYWSEEHVSEDFEMSLKLSKLGYVIRMATYHQSGFLEGVSLTVYDEIARWSKYAYGCSELMFQPVKNWYKLQIFTPIFTGFLFSNITLVSKMSTISYMGTYFAIALSTPVLIVNYLVVGLYPAGYGHIYSTTFANFMSLITIFCLISPVSNAFLKARAGKGNFFVMMLENYKWMVLMTIFMGGLPWHLAQPILCHLFSIDAVSWGHTAKELQKRSSTWYEFTAVLKGYKWLYLFLLSLSALMVSMAYFVPWGYTITGYYATLPLASLILTHALSPIVLNPNLMHFHN